MGVAEVVVAIAFFATLAKLGKPVSRAFAERMARGSATGEDGRIRAVEAQLQACELRLAQTEERVEELTEKLSFVENLLGSPSDTHVPLLPPS